MGKAKPFENTTISAPCGAPGLVDVVVAYKIDRLSRTLVMAWRRWWLHSVPLHIIPAKREVLLSEAYQDNDVIQQRMDVLEFIDSIWGKGRAPYYWDGDKLNPHVGLYQNDNLGGWMLAARNIGGQDAESVVREAAETIRTKMADRN
jgi:hypothetical protein